ncbi:MAG: hypothetical protein JW734_01300, partial [Candidatus Omnitrophica bacterium]|nr:hypothetical protein [Candidatus Omnitrophota bacterium]
MFNSKAKLTAVFLISALGFIVYFNSLGGQFIRDDNALVKNNIYIKNPANLAKCFTRNIALGSPEKWNSYRPLQMFTYMLDYQIWKLKPAGYHLTNILLHILTGIMLYFFIYAVFGDSILSLYTSLLFIAHPVHTQAVSYISGRADSLAAVFLLFCFILYIRFLGLSTKGTFLFMVISYLGALFSRENSLILPGLLILYHFSLKKKFRASSFSALSCIALIYIVLRLTLLKSLLSNISYPTTFIQRLPGFFAAMAEYFRLIILPFNLHASYGLKLFSFSDPKVIAGIFVTLILVFYALKKRKQDSLILFSIGWFFMALLPQSNLYPINAYMAEHWLYLPSVGFFLIVANFF